MTNFLILIIDDSPSYLKVLEKYLRQNRLQLTVIKALNGKEALARAEKKLPDLIITDWEMPEMNGIELIKHLRNNEKTQNIPIIMCSGKMTSSKNLNTAFEAGAVDYIRKPVDEIELTARVNSMLKLSSAYKHIKKQNNQLREQKEELSKKNKRITDSISYAKKIQKAMLPSKNIMRSIFKEHFVFFKPRDMVSGDFFWAKEINGFKILAAADCTGHGVSGAFMSILGISVLNEIVDEHNADKPNEILAQMSRLIMEQLRQTDIYSETLDTIDIALASLDSENKKLYYAGANNDLVRVNRQKLEIIKADMFSVGFNFEKEISFTNHVINVTGGECLYIFSDGYRDQFGGDKNVSFGYKNFQKLLLQISGKPMKEQKAVIDEGFELWKGENKQVDDVLVIGLKIEF